MTLNRQPILQDDALLLRPMTAADWPEISKVASDPAIWAGHPASDRWQEPVFRAFFEDGLNSGGSLVAIDRSSDSIIGHSRYDHARAQAGEVEIGWTFLAKSHWARNHSIDWNRRMKRLMLAHALASVEQVIFLIGETNLISQKAMANIGGRLLDRSFAWDMPNGTVTHLCFAIDRAGFAAGPLAQA
ncbi:MAG: GNAT family N-acetyltransferase [Sphingomonadales bacterium]|jgi:RimJ/RimL family protein N-acetyltransferase